MLPTQQVNDYAFVKGLINQVNGGNGSSTALIISQAKAGDPRSKAIMQQFYALQNKPIPAGFKSFSIMNPLWNPDQLEQLKRAYAQRQAMQQQQAAQQQAQAQAGKHTSGRGGFLTSLISEGGATGGAVTGAMAGSAFGPVGTIIGGALGGFAGGFGGSAVEQKVRDNNIDFGKADH
jgi:hypothetical protein